MTGGRTIGRRKPRRRAHDRMPAQRERVGVPKASRSLQLPGSNDHRAREQGRRACTWRSGEALGRFALWLCGQGRAQLRPCGRQHAGGAPAEVRETKVVFAVALGLSACHVSRGMSGAGYGPFGGFSSLYWFGGIACALLRLAIAHLSVRCILALCELVVMSAISAATWRATMLKARVQEVMADAIINLRYDEEGLFRATFINQQAFMKLRHKIGDADLNTLNDDDWGTHPLAARLRMFWQCGVPEVPCPTSVVSDALALVPAGAGAAAGAKGAKLTAAGRERLKRKLEKDYSSCVVSRETFPALCYLQCLWQQATDKFFEWLPWRQA